jgi:hypothetical protein
MGITSMIALRNLKPLKVYLNESMKIKCTLTPFETQSKKEELFQRERTKQG